MQFVFDRDFDSDLGLKPSSTYRPGALYTQEEFDDAVKRARADGYEDGRTSGRAEATSAQADSEASRQLNAIEALPVALGQLFKDADHHHAVLETQMLDFLISVFEQVAPNIVTAQARPQALREAQAAIRMALGSAALIVHLSPGTARDHGDELKQAARMAGFAGRFDVVSDPALAEGDARAEWDHGVMAYSFNDICQKIFDALDGARAGARERTGQTPEEDRA